jgi:ssRNA-specific RNase YbeY (16S rRNA maturation enzyme)
MNAELASMFHGNLSTLSTISETYSAYREDGRRLSIEEANRIAQVARESASASTAQRAIANMTIDDELFKTLNKKIIDSQDRLKDVISRDAQDYEQDFEKDLADQVICSALKTIKRYNGEILPDPEYYRIWRRHKCQYRV